MTRGLLVLALVLAVLLVGAAAWSHAGVVAHAGELARGHGALLGKAAREQLLGEPPTDTLAAAVLDDLAPSGLLGLVVLGPGRRELARAGEPPAAAPSNDEPFTLQGDRATLLLVLGPPRGAGEHAPDGRSGPPPFDGRGPPGAHLPEGLPPLPGDPPPGLEAGPPSGEPPGGGPLVLLLVYAPTSALDLQARSRGTVALASVGAVALLTIALAMDRAARKLVANEAELAQARHLAGLGEVSAVLAHEIRNPLAALKGHAQLLAELLPDEDRRHDRAQRVVQEAVRLERLTGDLLAFARKGTVTRAPVDPLALAREVAAGRPGVTVRGAAPAWPLDPERMRQVLTNLVENAVQVSPDAVEVEVRADTHLSIAVHDRGPGLPAEGRDRLFEPFVTTRTQGTGLGLAVARRLVELHGGTLQAHDRAGGGATFVVTLPGGS